MWTGGGTGTGLTCSRWPHNTATRAEARGDLDLNWKEHHRQPTILFADRPWVLSDASDHAQTRAEGSNTEARQ